MRFMNEYDIQRAVARFDSPDTPNLRTATRTLERLMDWANANSDGWVYWPKPARSAAKLMDLIEGDGTYEAQRHREENDVDEGALTAALAPIKSFLTRHGSGKDVVFPENPADIDLPVGYRWMDEAETEWYNSRPSGIEVPNVIVVQLTTYSDGTPCPPGTADLAVRL